jgi:hypothetical protein
MSANGYPMPPHHYMNQPPISPQHSREKDLKTTDNKNITNEEVMSSLIDLKRLIYLKH